MTDVKLDSEPSLERVPRVPGTRKILSSYVMATVNFYEIPGEQLLGTRKILTPLISDSRGLKFLTRTLYDNYSVVNKKVGHSIIFIQRHFHSV